MKEFSRGKFGLLFSVPSFQLIFYLAYGEQASMQQFPAKESGSWTSNYLVYITSGLPIGIPSEKVRGYQTSTPRSCYGGDFLRLSLRSLKPDRV